MSYQEKRTITSIISGILVLAAYAIHVLRQINAGTLASDDLKSWGVTMLVFVGIGMLASIVIQIIFHIAFAVGLAVKNKMDDRDCDDKEIGKLIESETIEDERDKLIGLKSMQIGFAVAGLGFLAGLILLAMGGSAVVFLNLLFWSFALGSLLEGCVQLHLYRKGS